MNFGTTVVVCAALAATLALGAAYSPTTVDKLLPGAGDKARQVRALLPPVVLAKLEETLPQQVKALMPPDAAGGAAVPTQPEAAKPAPPPPEPKIAAVPPAPTGPPPRPPVTVIAGVAAKKPVAVRIDAIGAVQPMASVTLRSRVDTQIEKIFVADGALVKADEVLVKLDSRQIEAQLRQAEAALAKDRTALEQANRDVARFADLVAKQATATVNLQNAQTAVASAKASIQGDEAAIENLKVQLSYYSIKAPISGRIGTFTTKAGNMARAGEAATALGTIMQVSPIYVAFSVPQRLLPELRTAIDRPDASVTATPQGSQKSTTGKVALIDNAIDAATGTITARAQFDNQGEVLWPGQLCNVRVTLRNEPDTITVPREAVQAGQSGNFVYVIEEGVAKLRPVTVGRIQDGESIITDGLKGGESIVIDGALALSNNAKVEVRGPVVPAADPAAPKKNPT